MQKDFLQPACHALAVLGVLVLSPVVSAGESVTRLSIGYDYTSGAYGQGSTTEIETVPIGMEMSGGQWRFNVTVPFIAVTGDGSVVPGAGGPMGLFGSGGGSTPTSTVTTESGLGDVTAGVAYALPNTDDFYEVSARVKFGTADAARGLGTGENDYYFQFDAVLGGDTVNPWFTLGYILTGDSATTTYEDVAYGSVGIMVSRDTGGSLGIGYDYRQSTVSNFDDFEQASAFISWRTASGGSVTLSGSLGLSDGAPDYGFNLTLRGGD